MLVPPSASAPARVLVVDDRNDNRVLLTRLLGRMGHTVTTAGSGAEALDVLGADPGYDLVLLDVDMPGMPGDEVLRRIETDQRLARIPVVMVSGMGDVDSIAECIELGADDFIQKPFHNRILEARVTSSLAKKRLSDWRRRYVHSLEEEGERSQRLISAMLPDAIAARLKAGEHQIADQLDDVSVLFADIVGFTERAVDQGHSALVAFLNDVFSTCDALVATHGLEKIKTIGDAYMAAGGLPEPCEGHLEAVAALALDMRAQLADEHGVAIRIGIHCGPAVAGVVGTAKPSYDVWGDTINVASRLESHGVPGEIQVSDLVRERLDGVMRFSSRGVVELKGRGPMVTHFLLGHR